MATHAAAAGTAADNPGRSRVVDHGRHAGLLPLRPLPAPSFMPPAPTPPSPAAPHGAVPPRPPAGPAAGLAGAGLCALACAGLWWLARHQAGAAPAAWITWAPTALLVAALLGLLMQATVPLRQWQHQRQQAMQDRLAEQRRRLALQQTLDTLPVALALCGTNDGPGSLTPNAALLQLLGADPAGGWHAAQQWTTLLAAQDHEPWQAAWSQALRSGQPQWLECSLRGPAANHALLAQITPCNLDAQAQMLVCLTPLHGDGGLTQQALLQMRQLLALAEDEKWHFGQAVHDELGQRLSGMAYFAKALQRKLQKAQRPEAEDAGWLTDLANESMSVARGLARGLLPVGSDDPAALGTALADLCEQASKSFGIPCRLSVDPGFDAGGAARASHLYHAVQELMNNAVRHGHAQQVQVQLQVVGDSQRVTVRDDGNGLPPTPLRRGMGLAGVRSRAAYLGAQFSIGNGPDAGVLAQLEWPLPGTATDPKTL